MDLYTLNGIDKKKLDYEALVVRKIRRIYSLDAEIALLRQKETKPAEYAEYFAYCEKCKEEARKEVK